MRGGLWWVFVGGLAHDGSRWLAVGLWGGLRWVYGVVRGGSGWFLIHLVVLGGGL